MSWFKKKKPSTYLWTICSRQQIQHGEPLGWFSGHEWLRLLCRNVILASCFTASRSALPTWISRWAQNTPSRTHMSRDSPHPRPRPLPTPFLVAFASLVSQGVMSHRGLHQRPRWPSKTFQCVRSSRVTRYVDMQHTTRNPAWDRRPGREMTWNGRRITIVVPVGSGLSPQRDTGQYPFLFRAIEAPLRLLVGSRPPRYIHTDTQ